MGFLAPWFLGGLAALGVPVFVHLLRRHISIPQPVSSLMFFERGTQSSTRHRRLRYLLLFALRSALVLLVGLAFANPFVRRAAADTNGRTLLIVLDNSFSMRAGTRFAEAKQQALAQLAAKPHSQKAQIMALGGQLEVMTQPISDDAQLRAALESIQPGDGHANFGELGRAIRTLSETVHGPIDLHLFSDMQRSAMPWRRAPHRQTGRSKAWMRRLNCPIRKIPSGRACRQLWQALALRQRRNRCQSW